MRSPLTPTVPFTAPLPMRTMLRMRGVYLDDDTEAGGAGAAVSDDEKGTARGDENDDTSFISQMARKYEKEDRALADAEDAVDGDGDTDDDGDDAEDPDAGTSDDADEDSDESDSGSADDDDEEHPDDAEEDSAEDSSDDDEDAEADEDTEEEDDEDASDETRTGLAQRGADLELKDVPKEYRPIVERKLRSIDAAFTRARQEQSTFRKERAQLLADQKFRTENPDMVITEMLLGDDALFEKVNERMGKLADPDNKKAFQIIAKDARKTAADAIEQESSRADAQEQRTSEVETLVRTYAAKNGIPMRIADLAVGNAISASFRERKKDLSNAEVAEVIRLEAKEFHRGTRKDARQKSQRTIQDRKNNRRLIPPGSKRPASASSPKPSAKGKTKVDFSNERSRVDAIMDSARRIIPGAR